MNIVTLILSYGVPGSRALALLDHAALTYCNDEEFPPDVSAALLALLYQDWTLGDAYTEWNGWGERDDSDFIEAVQEVYGDAVMFCDECCAVTWVDNTTTVASGDVVCDENCRDNYTSCDDCGDYVKDSTTIGDRELCSRCRDRNYSWCDECDDYYHDDYSYEHTHDDTCDCEAPHRRFLFPANGHGMVAQNERLSVELPKGTIDDEGIDRIKHLVYAALTEEDDIDWFTVNKVVEDIGPLWQAKRGNFTKRLSGALFKEHKVKLAPAVISEVGNLARAHSSGEATWHIEFTRDLNASADEFCHGDSCWWGGYAASRCCLKNWGGMGMRSYSTEDTESYRPSGRTWVQPLDDTLDATHHTTDAHAFVIFNSYGDLGGFLAARIIAHLTGKTYRKIEYNADGQYVNNEVGYLVADQATCDATESVYLSHDEHHQRDAQSVTYQKAGA